MSSSDAAALAAPSAVSRIPTLGTQSPASRPGKSSIPSPARGGPASQVQARKSKSILAMQHTDVAATTSHSDQSTKYHQQQQRKAIGMAVPLLNLTGVPRTFDDASTTPSATASKSPVMRMSTSPMTAGSHGHSTPSSKPLKAHARHVASPDTSKRKNVKGAATKVVFGRALASPRMGGAQKQLQPSPSVNNRVAQPAILADSVLDRSKPSRCISVSKAREPAAPAQRSMSVDKFRPAPAPSRSMSVEKPRLSAAKNDAAKFRPISPSPARKPDVKAAPNPVRTTVSLAAIPEAPRASAASAAKPTAPTVANVNPRPVKPSFSLNLAAVKQSASEQTPDGPLSGSSSLPSHVPKLNLTPVLQQREEEQGAQAAYKVAPAESKPAPGSKGQQPDEPADHYYYYPKLDSKEERRTMELISTLPRQPATHMKKIYSAMVEAKQNCEAIAFRGHRLLDQEKLAKKEEEMAEHIRQVEEEMNKRLAAKEQEARRKEEELRRQAEDFQRVKEEQEARITALFRQLQETQAAGTQASGQVQPGADGEEGSAQMSAAAASALRDLESMTANMSSMQDSVTQLSSRLGGVAVRRGGGGAMGAKEFMRELLKPAGGGSKVGGAGAGLVGAAGEDDRMQVKDIDS